MPLQSKRLPVDRRGKCPALSGSAVVVGEVPLKVTADSYVSNHFSRKIRSVDLGWDRPDLVLTSEVRPGKVA